MILLLFVLAGLIVGWVRGGSLKNMFQTRIHGLWLPIIALILEFLIQPLSQWIPAPLDEWAHYFVIVSYFMLFAFIYLNREYLLPMILLFLGTFANYFVISLNTFRMPVSRQILEIPMFENSVKLLESGYIPVYSLMGPQTKAAVLGDVFYVPMPYLEGFASVGDILLAAGVFLLLIRLMGRREKALA